MENLIDAYINLAFINIKNKENQSIPMPKFMKNINEEVMQYELISLFLNIFFRIIYH